MTVDEQRLVERAKEVAEENGISDPDAYQTLIDRRQGDWIIHFVEPGAEILGHPTHFSVVITSGGIAHFIAGR